MIRARQLPRKAQVRQSLLQIGKPVEKLPHILMHLIETLLWEKSRALHLPQTCNGRLHALCGDIPLHPFECTFKRILRLLFPTLPRSHDNSPPSHEYTAPDP